jgi:hypothetical protein
MLHLIHHADSRTVIFRSSSSGRYPGFAANVICFTPGVIADKENCTPISGTAGVSSWENQASKIYVSCTRSFNYKGPEV